MAYVAGQLHTTGGGPPGARLYRYISTDHPDVVEAANYFNNVTHNLNLAKGDIIDCFQASAVSGGVVSGTLTLFKRFAVTNVISNAAVTSAGRVNIAEIGGTGAISSGT